MKAVGERDGPTKALSTILCTLRLAIWFAVSASGFNNVTVKKVNSPLSLIAGRGTVR
jgi:hypothetical protein